MSNEFVQSIVDRIVAGHNYSAIEQEALSVGYTAEQVAAAYTEAQSRVTKSDKKTRITYTVLVIIGIGILIIAWPIIAVLFYLLIFMGKLALGIDIEP